MTARTAIFDMNETTLDLGPVRRLVDSLLPSAGGFTVWFQRLLQLSMSTTATGTGFQDFGTLAGHAFAVVAANGADAPPDDAFAQVAATIGAIEPFPEVPAALDRLKAGGWQLVALTNSGQAMVDGQVENNNLGSVFDHVLSCESIQTYKPAADVYRHGLEIAGCDAGDAWMVACHDWDLAGARAVGMNVAYVQRPSMAYAATYDPPDLSVVDFTALADALLEG